ncbi:MAG: AMP-binding protein [Gemmatimonadales bacterium]
MPDHRAGTNPDAQVEELLTRFRSPDLSLASVLCDGHPPEAIAFRVVEADLSVSTVRFGQLREDSERMAAALLDSGIGPGDRVATLMGKSTDYLVTLLGIWRVGAVHVPLFTAFAPPAIALRLRASRATLVVCDANQRAKLAPGGDMPADPPWSVIVSASEEEPTGGDRTIRQLLAAQAPGTTAAVLGGEAPMIHISTSGTTGEPKGVVIPAWALATFQAYMTFGLDLRDDDVCWNAADPGWAYGLYYAILGPMSLGRPSLLLRAGFSAELTWAMLDRFGVTNLAAAPTVYRALRASGIAPPPGVRLRCASSAGEPLTPDINAWAAGALGVTVRDHYGQTETGMLVNSHQHPAVAAPIKDGSMGRPMPGWSLEILELDSDRKAEPGALGRITVERAASPLAWFTGYHVDETAPAASQEASRAATASKLAADGRWYLTGDTGAIDADGDYFFTSRDDDVIIMAGYRIGPFEVESVLSTHPQVVESAAIGVPDELRGEVIEAHVVLRDPTAASDSLTAELQQLVKSRLAAHAYPRNIVFADSLPKTPSGKVQRFLLRRRRRAELARGGS